MVELLSWKVLPETYILDLVMHSEFNRKTAKDETERSERSNPHILVFLVDVSFVWMSWIQIIGNEQSHKLAATFQRQC